VEQGFDIVPEERFVMKIEEQRELAVDGGSVIKMEECNISTLSKGETWNIFGNSIPKQEVVFFSQVIILYIVIIIGLINLILDKGDRNLWLSLLSGSIGYLLPNPSLRKETIILQQNVG
jgi:hypothetical protein